MLTCTISLSASSPQSFEEYPLTRSHLRLTFFFTVMLLGLSFLSASNSDLVSGGSLSWGVYFQPCSITLDCNVQSWRHWLADLGVFRTKLCLNSAFTPHDSDWHYFVLKRNIHKNTKCILWWCHRSGCYGNLTWVTKLMQISYVWQRIRSHTNMFTQLYKCLLKFLCKVYYN